MFVTTLGRAAIASGLALMLGCGSSSIGGGSDAAATGGAGMATGGQPGVGTGGSGTGGSGTVGSGTGGSGTGGSGTGGQGPIGGGPDAGLSLDGAGGAPDAPVMGGSDAGGPPDLRSVDSAPARDAAPISDALASAARDSCMRGCTASAPLACPKASVCFANCVSEFEMLVAGKPQCRSPLLALLSCAAGRPTADWQCGSDGTEELKPGVCEMEGLAAVMCVLGP
jgi:hypothetical protein